MLRKIFYATFCLGALFSLVLLVLLPAQVVVNYDANGLPQDVGSKWSVIAFLLLFKVFVVVFCSSAPFFINHAYRADVWENSIFRLFLPSALWNAFLSEKKMRKLRESVLNLF